VTKKKNETSNLGLINSNLSANGHLGKTGFGRKVFKESKER
jgi:hypothetical protein